MHYKKVANFNYFPPLRFRTTTTTKKKKNRETSQLNYIIDQINFPNIYIAFCPVIAEYKFSQYRTFPNINMIIRYRDSLNKYKLTYFHIV